MIGLELAAAGSGGRDLPDSHRRGGLAAGISLALQAETARGEHRRGRVPARHPTIADGIAVKHKGELAGEILGEHARRPDRCRRTTRSLKRSSSASSARTSSSKARAPWGSLRCSRDARPGTGPVAVVLSGGNIDATTLISALRHGLTQAGRFLAIRLLIPHRPGQLRDVLDLIARGRGNVVSVDHHREGRTTSALRDRDRARRLDARRASLPGAPRGTPRTRGTSLERLGPPS